ncbi:hypothetical protein LJK88_38335 [Paenibacillus sp. P26]|nr:hypothetical protein LJK88_38335 [Paenibacillus sp. P26]
MAVGGRSRILNPDLFTLDADNIKDLDDFLFSVELVLGGSAYVVYSTHSHRPESPRCRVVVLPDRALTPDEHSAASRKLCEQIGIRFFDKKSFECQRLMYLPSCSADAELFFQVYEGAPVSVDGILAEYADWQDVSQWPRHPNEKSATLLSGKKAQDPTSKHGVIGLFCRAFSIDDGIEAFLSDQYSEGSMPNRYTYLHGTSANGLEVFPDQGLCYSHQDSDPLADGHTHNLFDAIRIHKFGHLDERVKEFTPAAKRPSHLAMEHFAIGLPEVKRLAAAEKEAEYADIYGEGGDEGGESKEMRKTIPRAAGRRKRRTGRKDLSCITRPARCCQRRGMLSSCCLMGLGAVRQYLELRRISAGMCTRTQTRGPAQHNRFAACGRRDDRRRRRSSIGAQGAGQDALMDAVKARIENVKKGRG